MWTAKNVCHEGVVFECSSSLAVCEHAQPLASQHGRAYTTCPVGTFLLLRQQAREHTWSEVSAPSDRSSLRVGGAEEKKGRPRPSKKEEKRGRAGKREKKEAEKGRRGRRKGEEKAVDDTQSEVSYGQPDTDLSRSKASRKGFSKLLLYNRNNIYIGVLSKLRFSDVHSHFQPRACTAFATGWSV